MSQFIDAFCKALMDLEPNIDIKEAKQWYNRVYEKARSPWLAIVGDKTKDSSEKAKTAFYVQTYKQIKNQDQDVYDLLSGFIFDPNKVVREKIFPFFKLGDHIAGFGVGLPKNIDIYDKKTKERIGTEQRNMPVVITSQGKLIQVDAIFKRKYNIRFQADPEEYCLYQTHWSLNSIRTLLTGKHQRINTKELFSKIRTIYQEFLYFNDDAWYDVHTLWDMGTYFFLLFKYYPLMELRGLKATAKSKTMTVSRLFTFNATEEMNNPSESTLFRETHVRRPTKYIDEAEKLFVRNKKGAIESDCRAELINSGFKYSGTVPRQERIKLRFFTVYYRTYSPTMIGSINGLYGATEDRAITHIMTKPPKGDKRGDLEPSAEDQQYQDIRDELYLFTLQNWQEVEKVYNALEDEKLRNRDLWIWKPLLALAKFIDNDLFDKFTKFAHHISEIKTITQITEDSFEFKILKTFYTLVCNDETKDILIQTIIDMNQPVLEKKNRFVSKYLNHVGFDQKRFKTNKGIAYRVNKAEAEAIIETICPEIIDLSSLSSQSS